jgi:hypothetical protein
MNVLPGDLTSPTAGPLLRRGALVIVLRHTPYTDSTATDDTRVLLRLIHGRPEHAVTVGDLRNARAALAATEEK